MTKYREPPKLTDLYWDCECPERYIHSKIEKVCRHCGATQEDSPDSHVSEVIDMFSHKRGHGKYNDRNL